MRNLPQVTGVTENALRSLLERQLQGTGISGYVAWVAMNYAEDASGPADLEARVINDTKDPAVEVEAVIGRLQRVGLLDEGSRPTKLGEQGLTLARSRVRAVTAELVAGIDQPELEVTYRVLDAVRAKAEALLAR